MPRLAMPCSSCLAAVRPWARRRFRPGRNCATTAVLVVSSASRQAPTLGAECWRNRVPGLALGALRISSDDGIQPRAADRVPRSAEPGRGRALRLGRLANHVRIGKRPSYRWQRKPRPLRDGEPIDCFDRALGSPVIAVEPLGHEAQGVAGNV